MIMEHETITLSRHATAVATAERKPPDAVAARPGPAEPAELELFGNQIAELSARIDAATYELLCHLHEFDRRHGWEGWRSCAHWLNWRTGLDLGAAREKLRVAARPSAAVSAAGRGPAPTRAGSGLPACTAHRPAPGSRCPGTAAQLRVRERRHFQKPAEVIQAPHQPLRLHLLLQVQVDVAAQGSVRRLRRGDDTAAAVSRRRAAR